MDLVALLDGGPEILEFKTHAIQAGQEPEVGARYEIQRAAYVAALSDLLGRSPAAMRFFFSATGGEVATPITPEQVARLRDRIVTLAKQVGMPGLKTA